MHLGQVIAPGGDNFRKILAAGQSGNGPGGNGGVDGGHEADGFLQGKHDLLVVADILVGDVSSPPTLRPAGAAENILHHQEGPRHQGRQAVNFSENSNRG